MVGESNRAMTETWWPIFSWSRLISTAPSIELPPSSKKLSSTPTCSTPHHLAPEARQEFLQGRARRDVGPGGRGPLDGRRGQGPAVHLAAGGAGQGRERDERGRHHVLGQAILQVASQRLGGERLAVGIPDDVGDQPRRARGARVHGDGRLAHRRDGSAGRIPPRPARCGSRGPSPGGPAGPGTRSAPSASHRQRSPVR